MRKRQIRKHKRGKPAARPIYKEGFFWIAFAVLVLTLAAFAAFQVLNKPFAGKAHGILTEQGVPELPGEDSEPVSRFYSYRLYYSYGLREQMAELGYELYGNVSQEDLANFAVLRGDQTVIRTNTSFFAFENLTDNFVLYLGGRQLRFVRTSVQEKPEATHIVEFKKEPLVSFYAEQRANGAIGLSENKAAEEYAMGLNAERDEAVSQLSQINPELPGRIKAKYTKAFNGIAVTATEEEAERIRNLSSVKAVYENTKVWALLSESVPQIKADKVWELTDEQGRKVKGEGVTIAVIDTGVDYTHADLGGCLGESCKVIGGYDFVNNDNDPMDDNGHGTHVAATAAGEGVLKGVAPKASIIAYKVLNAQGGGYTSDIIDAIEKAVDPNQDGDFSDRADIISLSLGGPPTYPDPLAEAVNNAVEAGTVAVVAAGNSGQLGSQTIGSPGIAEQAITVGAVNKKDGLAAFSSRGPVDNGTLQAIKPDVLAPGVDICAAKTASAGFPECLDDTHGAISGTSMATPHVSGAAALLLQAHPEWTPDDVKSALMSTSADLGLSKFEQGAGRIDAEKANDAEISTSPASFSINLWSSTGTAIRVRNLAGKAINADISIEFNDEKDRPEAKASPDKISLKPGEEKEIAITFKSSRIGASFGNVVIKTGTDYKVPFALSRLANVTIVAQSDETLSPRFILHSNDMKTMKEAAASRRRMNRTFTLPSGEYTAYVVSSRIDKAKYILYDSFKVGADKEVTVNLSMANAKRLNIKTETAKGNDIQIFSWTHGITAHGNQAEFMYQSTCYCPIEGPLYVSKKPEAGLDTDILIMYKGVEVYE